MTMSEILAILRKEFPDAGSELDYRNTFELLIAVILSAQTTDVAVNKVTKALFEKYPTPFALAKASSVDVMACIQTIGLYKNKAKHIISCAQMVVDKHEGRVPGTFAELVDLPGVGRKTANVVLSEGFNVGAIAVDTHVERVAKRLGIAEARDSVLQVEHKLMAVIAPEDLADAHILLLLLGRYHSTSRNKEDIYTILRDLKEKHQL